MLLKLVKRMDKQLFYNEVISLTNLGLIGSDLREIGLNVTALGMQPRVLSVFKLFKLILLLHQLKPDIVQTWMYHSDLLGGVVAYLCGIEKVCWNVRHCNLDADKNKPLTILTAKICAIFSRILPSRIICNSKAGLQAHSHFGYHADNCCVIPNGFETNKFFPDTETRKQIRKSLKITDDKFVFGNVGRFDKQKNHHDLLAAFALVLKINPHALLICCGKGVTLENNKIRDQIERLNISSNVLCLGYRKDVSQLLNAFDAYVSSSIGEGFSNSIGEAMASAVPCIVTNVGDSKYLVGSTGWTVDSGCSIKLAKGMSDAVCLSQPELSHKGYLARQRIVKVFSIKSVVYSFEQFYLKLLSAQ